MKTWSRRAALLLSAIALLHSRLNAQPQYIQGKGNLEGANTYYAANGVNVKFCTNSDGTNCVASGVTDNLGFGMYTVQFFGQNGNYWMFEWLDNILWGSSTQSILATPIAITGSGTFLMFDVHSKPRPSVPPLVAPPNNAFVYYNSPLTLKWGPELDAARIKSTWPRVYDIYYTRNGSAEALFVQNQNCNQVGNDCTLTIVPGSLGPSSVYTWRVLAKMNTMVGAPGDQYYKTTSLTRSFTTSSTTLQTIFTTQIPDPPIDSVNFDVATKFSSSQAGFVTALRFYQATGETGSHTVQLWSDNGGSLYGQVTIPAGGAAGWKEAALTTPVAISAGLSYRVVYKTNSKLAKKVPGGYPLTSGHLTASTGMWRPSGSGWGSWTSSQSYYFADVKVNY